MKKWLLSLGVLVVSIIMFNYLTVTGPVNRLRNDDPRNSVIGLAAHYGYYVLPTTLTLKLKAGDDGSPADIWRSFFAAAEAMHQRKKHFSSIHLTRGFTTEFTMSGDDFFEIGRGVDSGENPIYMLRMLPTQLRTPGGSEAYAPGAGGLFGVAEEIGNSSAAAAKWALGQ